MKIPSLFSHGRSDDDGSVGRQSDAEAGPAIEHGPAVAPPGPGGVRLHGHWHEAAAPRQVPGAGEAARPARAAAPETPRRGTPDAATVVSESAKRRSRLDSAISRMNDESTSDRGALTWRV